MPEARAVVRFGGLAAVIVFVPLAALAFLAYGLRECGNDCGPATDLLDAWLLALVYAALFGLVAGFAAAGLKPALQQPMGPRLATLALVVVIAVAGCALVWAGPRVYLYVQYLRTPREQLPPGDPRRVPSECTKAKLPKDTICGY